MVTSFFMPTRVVAGQGSLATIGSLARDLGMTRVLVVSDPVISAQPFHAAALGALAEMSRSGQVIYLTHHRHVCELAREACPEARILKLGP